MGGAPITLTLYRNGILIDRARRAFVHDLAVEAQMRASFDTRD